MVCECLEAVFKKQIQKLVINIPPGHAKPCDINGFILERTKGRIPLGQVVAGDFVLTHLGRFKEVLLVHEQGILPVLEITTFTGRSIRVAHDHPVLTTRGWILAKDLNINDILAEVHSNEISGTCTISKQESRLLAYLIGDGSLTGAQKSFTNNDPDVIMDFIECASYCGFDTFARVKQGKTGPTYRIALRNKIRGNGDISKWLESHGLDGSNSYTKFVPQKVMSATPDIIAEFLGAYWSCDGYVIKKDESRTDCSIGCDSVSLRLVKDIQHLLTRIGVQSRIRTKLAKIKTQIQGDLYKSYTVIITDMDNGSKFALTVPIKHAKNKELLKYTRVGFDRVLNEDKVVSINPDGNATCRCLTVDDDHSFSYNDIAVHNSYLTAVYFPAWCWLQDPRWQGIFASYASDLAERDSIRTRDLIEHPWYQGLLDPVDGQVPWVLKRDSNRKDLFTNTLGGFRIALGVTGMGTGWRGDCIVVDDPIKATDAKSKAKLDYVIHWYYQQMSSRLKDPRTGQRITIMQRLSSKDLTGEIKNRGDHEMLVLPSEYEPKHKTRVFIYPIDAKTKVRSSKPKLLCQDPREKEGELLFPQFFTPEVLQQAKKDLGSEGYAGQHQQRPVPAGGNIFKYKWFRFYRPDGSDSYGDSPRPDSCNNMPARIIPDKFDRILISLDAAFKDQPENDYVAFHVWGGLKADRFLLDRVKEHLSFTDTLATFKRLCKKWPLAFRKIVEDKANGSAVINTLQSEISGIIAIEPEGGKEARAFAVQPQVESGNVYLPEGVDWLGEFLEEVCTFPKASHDDDVDAMTQALMDMLVGSGQRETEALGDLS